MATLDHVGFSVSNFEKALSFYETALKPLGIKVVMKVGKDVTGGQYEGAGFGKDQKPDFWIGTHAADNHVAAGVHLCFVADSRAQVDDFYKAAIAAGGKDNGPPGVREHYSPTYYAAFVHDLDGHNIEACIR